MFCIQVTITTQNTMADQLHLDSDCWSNLPANLLYHLINSTIWWLTVHRQMKTPADLLYQLTVSSQKYLLSCLLFDCQLWIDSTCWCTPPCGMRNIAPFYFCNKFVKPRSILIRFGYEKGVLPSIRPSVCLSVCQTRELWQYERNVCPDFYTIWNII